LFHPARVFPNRNPTTPPRVQRDVTDTDIRPRTVAALAEDLDAGFGREPAALLRAVTLITYVIGG
jgi:hypothetical protein